MCSRDRVGTGCKQDVTGCAVFGQLDDGVSPTSMRLTHGTFDHLHDHSFQTQILLIDAQK